MTTITREKIVAETTIANGATRGRTRLEKLPQLNPVTGDSYWDKELTK